MLITRIAERKNLAENAAYFSLIAFGHKVPHAWIGGVEQGAHQSLSATYYDIVVYVGCHRCE